MTSNGRGSDTWRQPWTHLRFDRRSSGYCRVTMGALTATTVAELAELVDLIEQDADLSVVVFAGADPDRYLAQSEDEELPAWSGVVERLALAPVVSVASIRGRACRAGTEFVLACDLRFASRENTSIGRFEVGDGHGPALARLSHLVGPCRALEILLVGSDLDGPRAAQYGYVNRLIADDQLDGEVDRIAARLGRLDRAAIRRTRLELAQAA